MSKASMHMIWYSFDLYKLSTLSSQNEYPSSNKKKLTQKSIIVEFYSYSCDNTMAVADSAFNNNNHLNITNGGSREEEMLVSLANE